MASRRLSRLEDAVSQLADALERYAAVKGEAVQEFLAVAKAFEVAIEYAWKDLKRIVEDKGLEAYAPKDAVREAARLGLIDEPAFWIECINARNASVHDYFTIPPDDYCELAKCFNKELREYLRR